MTRPTHRRYTAAMRYLIAVLALLPALAVAAAAGPAKVIDRARESHPNRSWAGAVAIGANLGVSPNGTLAIRQPELRRLQICA